MKTSKILYAIVVAVAGSVTCTTQVHAQAAGSATAITQPSLRVRPNFNVAGIIRDVPVKSGDKVEAGQLLIGLDDSAEVAKYQALELEAKSEIRIKASIEDAKAKKIKLKRIEDLRKINGASPSELEEAQVAVVYADAQTDIAKLEREKAILEAKQAEIRIKQMKMLCPVKAVVESVNASAGEISESQKEPIALVVNDPLWVEIHLPTSQSLKLKMGEKLDVAYTDEPQQTWTPAEVIYKAPVADAASDTQLVRLQLANPQGKETGLQVAVRLPNGAPAIGAAPAAAPAAAVPASANIGDARNQQ